MERENILYTDEEVVARILGLPLERIEYLNIECGMPVSDPEFSSWFVENSELILSEMKSNFERSLFPREFGPELAEAAT